MVPEKVSTTEAGWTRVIKPLDILVSMSMTPKKRTLLCIYTFIGSQMWGNKESLEMSQSPLMSVGKSAFSK